MSKWQHRCGIIMAALRSRCRHYILPCNFFLSIYLLLSFFYSSPNLSGRTLDVYHTLCSLSANLECRSEMCCTRLARNTGCIKWCKKSPSIHHRTTLSGYIFACRAISSQLRHVSTIRRKLVKQQYLLLHMSAHWRTSAHKRLRSFR